MARAKSERSGTVQSRASTSSRKGRRQCRPCVNCGDLRRHRRQGLCWKCRERIESCDLAAPRRDTHDARELAAGVDVPASAALPCPGPLPGVAGSPQRMLALAMRADAKMQLFSAADRPRDSSACRTTLRMLAILNTAGVVDDADIIDAAYELRPGAGTRLPAFGAHSHAFHSKKAAADSPGGEEPTTEAQRAQRKHRNGHSSTG